MHTLLLKFDTVDEVIHIDLEPNENAIFFAQNLKQMQKPADRIYYNKTKDEVTQEFIVKAQKARVLFDFDWDLQNLTQDNFNSWHRDIETFDLSKYPPWSQEKGDFFIDLHESLHATESALQIQHTNLSSSRMHIQIKWFNNSLAWPQLPQFISENDIQAGDIVADYPHIGKTPHTCMMQNDNANLSQSCRLPDLCPPGFVIHLEEYFQKKDLIKTRQQLNEWYRANQEQLAPMFSLETMLYYNGLVRIGKIKSQQQVSILKTCKLNSVSIV